MSVNKADIKQRISSSLHKIVYNCVPYNQEKYNDSCALRKKYFCSSRCGVY